MPGGIGAMAAVDGKNVKSIYNNNLIKKRGRRYGEKIERKYRRHSTKQ